LSTAFATKTLNAGTDGSTDLTLATQVRVFNLADSGGEGGSNTGNYQDIADGGTGPGVPFGTSVATATSGSPLAIVFHNGASSFSFGNANWGTFTATQEMYTTGANTVTVTYQGTFTPGTLFGGLTSSTADMIFTFNQTGGAGNAVSGSATLVTPATVQFAPEINGNVFFSAISLLLGAVAVVFGRKQVAGFVA